MTLRNAAGWLAIGLGIAFVSVLSGALVGGLIGAIVGRLTENPNDPYASLDPAGGGFFGSLIGAIAGLVLCLAWALFRATRQQEVAPTDSRQCVRIALPDAVQSDRRSVET